MEKLIKVVQIGCGKMSKYTMRYAIDGGCQIVGAVDINPDIIGSDIAAVMECDDYGVKIQELETLDELLSNTHPDIAIITTMSLLNDIKDVTTTCINHGVNVITTCEEAFFAQNSNPGIWKEIDVFAKANNCTVTGCGYQDIFWGNLNTCVASSTHNITKIKGRSSYNVEDYGLALAQAHGAGLTLDEFDREVAAADNMSEKERTELINKGEFKPSYMWNVVGWLADKLNLQIVTINQKCIPTTYEEELHSSTLDMTIPKGNATGMNAIVTATTTQGITIEAECIGKVYASDEFDANVWTIYGEPDTTINIERPNTVELTCADLVNRIPDVINANAGFISTSKLPDPTYKVKSLNEYVK